MTNSSQKKKYPIMTLSEAGERWEKSPNYIRNCIIDPKRGKTYDEFEKQQKKGETYKSGTYWLVSEKAMTAVFGPEPGKEGE